MKLSQFMLICVGLTLLFGIAMDEVGSIWFAIIVVGLGVFAAFFAIMDYEKPYPTLCQGGREMKTHRHIFEIIECKMLGQKHSSGVQKVCVECGFIEKIFNNDGENMTEKVQELLSTPQGKEE